MHLVDRLKNKEESALQELMSLYGDYLLRTAFLLLKDKQTCEEVVQDTFIAAYEKIHQLDEHEKLKSWLTSITINRCRMIMRKWSWKNILLNLDWTERTQGDEKVEGPETKLLVNFENKSLSEAIQKLDYRYREVIILYYFNELKISEIAQLLKAAESTVKSRLKRGRAYLKETLAKGEDGSASERESSG
ncbi:RNA polymerase [Bacillus sp. LL01]|uniref:RNA polymerase sigma factor n=1 Tax=Bacillus sp. LL01 TaxID=1665556 RepID=UPI00064D1591|nr:sigma-70 family RNA polymerase sigma factor [Bacillus sp. LL01]KMJ58327.1 RNA polymerase [Bacillus sp. LL01]